MNSYKGYSLFNDVKNKNLQAYNRVVAMTNIICDVSAKVGNKERGKSEGTTYANHFTNEDKVLMKGMTRLIKEEGIPAARATFNA